MNNNVRIELSKELYSENVMRKSLYWLSEYAKWKLSEDQENWKIQILSDKELSSDFLECKLHDLLNDFKIREKIDYQSRGLREKVILKALEKIYASY